MPERVQSVAAAAILLLCSPVLVSASVFVPLSIEQLAAASTAVVVGEVARVDAIETANDIRIEVVIEVVDTLRGADVGAVLTLREHAGGPRFELGEEVLLFLTLDAAGAYRVSHGALGKFRLVQTGARGLEARPNYEGAAFLLSPGAEAPASVVSWQSVEAVVEKDKSDFTLRRAQGERQKSSEINLESVRPEPVEGRLPRFSPLATGSAALAGFRITEAGRFFEPDEGIPVDFRLDFRGDMTLGFVQSQQAIDAALAAWTDVDGATITLRDRGETNDFGRVCPGPNKVIFNDPEGILAPPVTDPNDPGECHGELARGIQRTSRFESKSFNGLELERVSCGFLILANGWGGCDVWTPCNVAEIAAHELGHVLGLGHSSEDPNEPDAALRAATMYYRAHFDGRCATLQTDDMNGARFVYPAELPPTITTTTPLPNGLPGMFYSRPLAATGGAGDFVWSLVGGGFPGMTVSPDGTLSGIPEVNGTSFFQVRAVDSRGDNHVKVLGFTAGTPGPLPATATPSATISPTPSVTATATSTSTPSPPATTTPTPTMTVEANCPGDCDRSGNVTVDEILTLVSIALGTLEPDTCLPGDLDGDGAITVDEILQAVNAALGGCHGS